MTENVQIIERDGQPEYAVVPIEIYRRLVECAEDAEDIQAFDRAMAEVARGEDEVVPEEVARRLFGGEEHPVRGWREYRGLTQKDLAQATGAGKSYISQLEAGRKTGSLRFMRTLAEALEVSMEDLIPPE
ncbi:helix-turn-helix domain-containing protein [Thiohalorhabdus sp.]|uniref:helix-turn-helix domain-containing protein n=1 Tax=Thiohalorhabdus sp. TaxID=3094134 RepID=UPI002FC3745B